MSSEHVRPADVGSEHPPPQDTAHHDHEVTSAADLAWLDELRRNGDGRSLADILRDQPDSDPSEPVTVESFDAEVTRPGSFDLNDHVDRAGHDADDAERTIPRADLESLRADVQSPTAPASVPSLAPAPRTASAGPTAERWQAPPRLAAPQSVGSPRALDRTEARRDGVRPSVIAIGFVVVFLLGLGTAWLLFGRNDQPSPPTEPGSTDITVDPQNQQAEPPPANPSGQDEPES